MSDEPQTAPRRRIMNEPGEPLLAPVPAQQASLRFQEWMEFTGVAPSGIVHSDLVANPLPMYPERFELGRRRWHGTRAEAMWHPLLWLPPRVAGRYLITDDEDPDGTREHDDIWAVRVALEATTTGLYDETTGTWIDILALAGINIDDPAAVDRVQRWLDGAPDDALDRIDLTPIMENPGDPAWAATVAAGYYEDLRVMTWTKRADSLLESCDLIIDTAGDRPLRELITDTLTVLLHAAGSFHQLDVDEANWWADLADPVSSSTTVDDLVNGPVAAVIDRLTDIRERFWPEVQALIHNGAEPVAVTTGGNGNGTGSASHEPPDRQ